MSYLTPSEFETAVKIERTCGRSGFGALLAAAIGECGYFRTLDLMGDLWPDCPSEYHWVAGTDIGNEYAGQRFEIFLSAAALHADLENQRKIEQVCPGLNEELSIRYNTPGGLIPGETRVLDGRTYRCVEITDDYGETVSRKVVEVAE